MPALPQARINIDGKSGKQILAEIVKALYDGGFHKNGVVVPGRYSGYGALSNKTGKEVAIVRFHDKMDIILEGKDPADAFARLQAESD